MKIKAFKINQYSNNGKKYNIYVSSIDIFDLKDYVYVKTVKDYSNNWEFVTDCIFWKQSYDNFNIEEIIDTKNQKSIEEIKEVQREKKDDKIKKIWEYLTDEAWIFPTSILLWNKSKTLININENVDWLNTISINEESKWKEWFFIIDWQHRVFWLLTFLLNKLITLSEDLHIDEKEIENKVQSIKNNLDPVVNKINVLLDQIWTEKRTEFINNNKFELPTVIINELNEDKMAVLFADINSNATKLDSNLETWIYWHKTKDKKGISIFVHIWEKLNSNPNSPLYGRFKIPTNLYPDKFSKIWIKPFCDNSLKMLNVHEKRSRDTYISKPFNLLLDKLIKYEEKISDESEQFIINWLTVVYFASFYNAKLIYWEENFKKINFNFINTNNLWLYLYIIKYIFLKLYTSNSDNFIDLFYNNSILSEIGKIFDENIVSALKLTYEKYDYFEKWKAWWSWWAKEAEITLFFKKKLYKIEESVNNKKTLRSMILEKEKEILDII